ncbi:MAG TPA: hypothetical protein VJQ82_05730 [Terriglobales bacterium]|nr:hypothetical protein [Terriglobales bacterium]
MTEMPIPEDIHSASNAVISTVFGDGYFNPTLWEAIARALMAERERCAQIVEHRPEAIPDRQELAAYIRSGRHSPFAALAEIHTEAKRLDLE